jgi:hypothetical protein
MTRRPHEDNFRRPDVVIGTRDWEAVERFLCNVRPDETAELRETRKQHVRIVLQDGERWYLNLLVSETAQRSRITSMAAAKLGRGSEYDNRMHLKVVNGRDVPITVEVVDTARELVAGESLPPGELRPHMVLTPEDERRIQGMMLTRWMGKADLLKGWASQGRKKNQPSQEARGREAGEQMCFKHLKVKIGNHVVRIAALFDKNVPSTMIEYRAVAMLNLNRSSSTSQWVTTAHGKRECSNISYQVSLLTTEGCTKLVRADGVKSTAQIGISRKSWGASVHASEKEREVLRNGWRWDRADMVIRRDNMDCKPDQICGWSGWPEGSFPLEVTGSPGFYIRKGLKGPSGRN